MTDTIDIVLEEQEGTESRVAGWQVEVGAAVTADQPICDLETDKVNMEIAAPAAGVLVEILKNGGDPVEPGDVLGRIAVGANAGASAAGLGANKSVASKSAAKNKPAAKRVHASMDSQTRSEKLSPAVKYLIKEHGLNPAAIAGTGRGGRITRSDVIQYMDSPAYDPSCLTLDDAAALDGAAALDSTTATAFGADPLRPQPRTMTEGSRLVPHTPMRSAIARHMVKSLLEEAPHVTSIFEADFTSIIEHRKWHKKEYAEQGVKLTFTAYIIKAATEALKAVPEVNSRYRPEGTEIYSHCHMGIGTALGDKGLVVPVIRHAEALTLFETARELHRLTDKARRMAISQKDCEGGTLTISNHGVSGSLIAAPIIINQPQSAILGIGKLEKRVKVETVNGVDEIKIKPMAYVTLSIDHRVLDAHQTNLFLAKFVETLENWGR